MKLLLRNVFIVWASLALGSLKMALRVVQRPASKRQLLPNPKQGAEHHLTLRSSRQPTGGAMRRSKSKTGGVSEKATNAKRNCLIWLVSSLAP